MVLPLDDRSHRTIIGDAMRDLNQTTDWRTDEYRLLTGGLSGSAVYVLQQAGEPVVLKVTSITSAPELLIQADREVAFYQHLAPGIPLTTPRLLAASSSRASGVAILLAASEPAPLISAWTESQYTEVAAQLGHLHGRFWGRTDRLHAFQWLRPDPPPAVPVRCNHAALVWQSISERDDLNAGMMPRRLRTVIGLVARIPALVAPPALPKTLCHGDCHPDNLLRDETGGWIWADWQAVGIGQGAADLTFFWQRAEMAGGTVPRDAMLAAYLEGLEVEGADTPTPRQLDQALAWAELTSWLVDWPPFLGGVSSGQLGTVLDRIEDLTRRLVIDRAV